MSSRKPKAAPEPALPNPDRGGAWYRKSDGTLVRDRTEEQHVPEDEPAPVQPEPAANQEPITAPAITADSAKES